MEPIPRNRALVVWRKNYVKREKIKKLRTICEVLRELYRKAEERDDAFTMTRLEEAYDMAKRMQNKLKEYASKNKDRVFLIIDDDEMLWLSKSEFKARETKQ